MRRHRGVLHIVMGEALSGSRTSAVLSLVYLGCPCTFHELDCIKLRDILPVWERIREVCCLKKIKARCRIVRIRSATMSVCPLSIDQIQVEIVSRYMQVEEEVGGREHDVDSEGEQVV